MFSIMNIPSHYVLRELDVFLAFSWRDWSSTIIPGSIFAISAARSIPHGQSSFTSIITSYLLLLSWLTLYIYFFNLSNQIIGVDEDRINKPDRPIPSGKVTIVEAKRRWVIALSVYLSLAVFKPMLLLETICWVLTTAFLCVTSLGNNWLGKNVLAMPPGAWSLLSASWKTIAPLTTQSKHYILALSLWAGLNTQIQDLRDVEGDTALGRKTMPIVFGDRPTRCIITFLLIPASFAVVWMGGVVPLAPFTLTVVHLYLGYRIMHAGSSRYDHKTYMIYTYIFCLMLGFIAGEGLTLEMTGMPQAFFKWMITASPALWNSISND